MGERNAGLRNAGFLMTNIILLVVFIGLIRLVFDFHKIMFIAEMLLLLVFMLIGFISLIGAYNNSSWGWVGLTIAYALVLMDSLVIYFLTNDLSKTLFVVILAAALGFIVSVVKIRAKEEEKKEEPLILETYVPGKYLASKTGTTYHAATCEWAKKIRKQNQLWLHSIEEAEKKGYKKHDCLG